MLRAGLLNKWFLTSFHVVNKKKDYCHLSNWHSNSAFNNLKYYTYVHYANKALF